MLPLFLAAKRSKRELQTQLETSRLTDVDAWHGRVVVWLAAAMAGLVVVIFALLAEEAIALFFHYQQQYKWLPLIVMPLAGMIIVWLTNKWFKGAAGSGIPQTIAALHATNPESKYPFLIGIKLAAGKIVLGVTTLAAGFSAGREGPSVQVAASIMHAFRHFLPRNFVMNPKHLILAGGAAGISAAFNTPLAGIIFAIEELGRQFESRTNGVLISAIVLSGLVSVSLQGNYTHFGKLTIDNIHHNLVFPVVVCGVVCGILGGLFSRTLLTTTNEMSGMVGRFRKIHPIYWAGFCGLMVALLGYISHGAAHGSGYIYTKEMLDQGMTDSWQYAPIKFLATIFTYLSGVPGGIFAPSLSIGAGIGSDLLPLFDVTQTSTIIALCMAGFLAGVTQAPITSFIIVMEMIDSHEMVISLMAIALISSIISKLFSPPLYTTLADRQQIV